MRRRIRREVSRDRQYLELAPENIPAQHKGMAPSLPFIYPATRAPPASHLVPFTAVRGPEDILSSPLGQYILSYEPPRGFSIPPFAIYDGSSDPYDHMLHFNQAMILSAGNDRLLCKVFPTSLKGPALAWFHQLPRGSINSFSEFWAAFVSQYLCSVRQKGNINSLQTIFKWRMSLSGTSPGDLDRLSNKSMHTTWMRSSRTFEEALSRLPFSSSRYHWTRLQRWRNYTDGQTDTLRWKTISEQPPRQ